MAGIDDIGAVHAYSQERAAERHQPADRAHRDAALTHALLAAGLYQQHVQHARQTEIQRQQLQAQQAYVDAHLQFLWSQYLDTQAGQAYTAWQQSALLAADLEDSYSAVWQQTWADELAATQGALPAAPVPSRVGVHPGWFLALSAVAAAMLMFWWITGDAVTGVILAVLAAGIPATILCSLAQSAAGRRARDAAAAAGERTLAARAQERVERYGMPVVEESYRFGWRIVDGWAVEDRPLRWLVEDFRRRAFVTYPRPEELPGHLCFVQPPRRQDPRFPEPVNTLLGLLLGGQAESAAAATQDRVRVWAEGRGTP